jgi:hypothetical protein
MNSPTPLPDRSDQHAASQTSADAVRQVAVPFAEAANDDDFYRNPLWIVAFALASLFAILACLAASG